MSSSSGSIINELILIVILTIINGIFSAAELAFVSIDPNKLAAQGKNDKKTQDILKVVKNSSEFLAIIQVGITFAGFLSSASAATSLAKQIEFIFGKASWAHQASVILVTIVLSFFTLVFGELYPKQVALRNTVGVARAFILPIAWFGVIIKPIVWLLPATTNLLLKITGQGNKEDTEAMTRDEMIYLIESARQSGGIKDDEYNMFEGVISLRGKMAREIMIPRTDTFMVNVNDDIYKNVQKILDHHYSRIPVYQESRDDVIGIVHVKSILEAGFENDFDKFNFRSILNEPYFAPETITVDKLLLNMREQQQQMAILLDEYGGVVGIVTIEDLVEEIVGEIDDETDQADILYRKITDDHYLVKGTLPLDEFNELFKVDFVSDDVDTIAGFVIEKLGKIPQKSQKLVIELDGLKIVSGKVEGSRLVNLDVWIEKKKDQKINE